MSIAMNINASTSTQEIIMSQGTQQDPDQRRAPALKQKKQEDPIIGLSPDDDLGGGSDNTGKPGGAMK